MDATVSTEDIYRVVYTLYFALGNTDVPWGRASLEELQ